MTVNPLAKIAAARRKEQEQELAETSPLMRMALGYEQIKDAVAEGAPLGDEDRREARDRRLALQRDLQGGDR